MDKILKISEKMHKGNILITDKEALTLFESNDLLSIATIANDVRWKLHPEDSVSFVVDRNINYTDGCITECGFCGFHNKPSACVTLNEEQLLEKVGETIELGGTGILLQGGMNPDLPFNYYINILKAMKETYPEIHIHGFSPPEIIYFAEKFQMLEEEVIEKFVEAGLSSIPGGGAEILSDRVRKKISPKKFSSERWIDVMRKAHKLGLKTTATMMFGIGENFEDRIEHFRRVRELQEETGGFTAFIPWTYQIYKNRFIKYDNTGFDYLKTLAIARIYLSNIPNIQASWVTQGKKMGQISLSFGANDMGSVMIEENVVKSVGVSYTISTEELVALIHQAGFDAVQRTNTYGIVNTFKKEQKSV